MTMKRARYPNVSSGIIGVFPRAANTGNMTQRYIGAMSMRKSTIPATAGIYFIRNVVNQKFYIGSAKDLQSRWHTHRASLKKGNHHNPHLQAAWNKYGADVFVFEVIELVESDQLVDRETYWLTTHNAPLNPDCYNIRLTADTNRGYKHSDAARALMSTAQKQLNSTPERKAIAGQKLAEYNRSLKGVPKSEEHRKKIAIANTGKRKSEETRRQMSESRKGKPNLALRGRKLSSERRAKLSECQKGKTGALHPRSKPVYQIDKHGNVTATFAAVREAARITGIGSTSILNCLHGRSRTAGGFIWRYVNGSEA